MTKRHEGSVRSWDARRGFGFIARREGPDVFAHIKDFADRSRPPRPGQKVRFALGEDARGRPRARSIRRRGDARRPFASRRPLVAGGFLAGLGVAVMLGASPAILLAIYVLASAVTAGVYFVDKRAARRGRRRTPESTLHVLSLLGGWPGALLAQQQFRHKTRKASFQWVFRATVALNLAAFAWLHTQDGSRLLAAIARGAF